MTTLILQPYQIETAAELLRKGECVAFPTETVYGLGANALLESAVAKVFIAKGRPANKPLIVHCYDRSQIASLAADWPKEAEVLMEAFWPGPLTLIFKKQPFVPAATSGGGDTVALRFPSHPLAIQLLKATALPIAAPSANKSGGPSPVTAAHVWDDLHGKIAAILDGGPTKGGLESTVLDCRALPFQLVRPGAITLSRLEALAPIKDATVRGGDPELELSAATEMVLVVGAQAVNVIRDQVAICVAKGLKVAVLGFSKSQRPGAVFLDLGNEDDLETAASRLYPLLRRASNSGFDIVFIQGLPERGLGRGVMDRLRKTATKILRT